MQLASGRRPASPRNAPAPHPITPKDLFHDQCSRQPLRCDRRPRRRQVDTARRPVGSRLSHMAGSRPRNHPACSAGRRTRTAGRSPLLCRDDACGTPGRMPKPACSPVSICSTAAFPTRSAIWNWSGCRCPAIWQKCRSPPLCEDRAGRPPWRAIYENDTERRQDWAEAIATFDAVTAAYRRLGYELVTVPPGTVEERARFVLSTIAP